MAEENELPSFLKMVVGAAARHALAALAGALVANGAVQGDQTTQFVSIGSGIVIWLAGYAWSAVQKHTISNPPE
jgi:hypothetical protein